MKAIVFVQLFKTITSKYVEGRDAITYCFVYSSFIRGNIWRMCTWLGYDNFNVTDG